MSYDLVVFEKSKVPSDAVAFLAWYQEQIEWGGDYDYNDIMHASSDLQEFYHNIRIVFPPMNGAYAPSDKELSERPDLEERLCDYCIGEDIIVLSLAYSMANSAYDIVKRAAYFAGVGFFSPSDGETAPTFFVENEPMILEGEWFGTIQIHEFGSVTEKLREMTEKKHSYLYLTDQIGSYIQVGGYGGRFTVEKRIYTKCMSYSYQKAGYSERREQDGDDYVIIAGNQVKVKPHRVLSNETVEQLFWDFFNKTETTDLVDWVEMTF